MKDRLPHEGWRARPAAPRDRVVPDSRAPMAADAPLEPDELALATDLARFYLQAKASPVVYPIEKPPRRRRDPGPEPWTESQAAEIGLLLRELRPQDFPGATDADALRALAVRSAVPPDDPHPSEVTAEERARRAEVDAEWDRLARECIRARLAAHSKDAMLADYDPTCWIGEIPRT